MQRAVHGAVGGRPRRCINISLVIIINKINGISSFNVYKFILQVELLHELAFRWDDISDVLMVSRVTLSRRVKESGMTTGQYSEVSDEELDRIMAKLVKDFPKNGIVMMWDHHSLEKGYCVTPC